MATDNTDQKYLSLEGLKTFWSKIKDHVTTENAKIKVSVGKNGEIVDVKVDEKTGRILTINDATLKTRLDAIDGAAGTVAGLDTRLDTAESDIDALQEAVTKLNGDVNTDGSVKKQVDTALRSAKSYTDALETELRDGNNTDTLKSLRDSINSMTGNSGSVATAINNAINALDVEDSAIDGQYVSSVSETDGKIAVTRAKLPTYSVTDNSDFVSVAPSTQDGNTVFTISTSNIAKADDLTALTANVRKLDQAETGRVSVLEKQVAALASATHFIGVKTALPATAANGDICIVGNKEYIRDETTSNVNGKAGWVELGDVTDVSERITEIEKSYVSSFGGAKGAITIDDAATAVGAVDFAISDNKLTGTVNVGTTSFGGKTGAITVNSGSTTAGDVNFAMSDNKLTGKVVLPNLINGITVADSTTIDMTLDTTTTPGTPNIIASAKTGAVASDAATLTTGGQVYTYVTGVVNGLNSISNTATPVEGTAEAEAVAVEKPFAMVTSVSQTNGTVNVGTTELGPIPLSAITALS